MAVRHSYFAAPREAVWAALADGARYADWVVGTQEILREDPAWPAVGSQIEFSVGWGPLKYRNRTVVRICEPLDRLELEIKVGLLGTVRVAFQLLEWGEGTVAIVDEHPLRGISAGLHGPPGDMILHLRNRLMLRNLTALVQEKKQAGAGAPVGSPTSAQVPG
ncbi:SRPBCC family protein [Spirillospora sp. NPDC048911]|uniref:SRPBCC family protein n=1 Tax=Spirillospora sp. NPDC048911 TaxID=3364527 RepID=UPI00372170A8